MRLQIPNRPYWPTHGWRASSPDEQGIESRLLVHIFDSIREHNLNIHSISLIRNGFMVLDACFKLYGPGIMHDLASCTKSFTSTLIGIAIDKGFIPSVKTPVMELLPGYEIANVDDRKKALTLEHLLTMSTGMACYADPGEITLREMFMADHWAEFVLGLPMIEEPGTRFEYCSPASYLLSVIVHETTGMTMLEFAGKHLFDPLGITDVAWPAGPQGIQHGWGDLHLKPHDMAKLGFLFLNRGVWDGKQIVSSRWVKAATANHAKPPEAFGYGYQWWLISDDMYSAIGRGGQYILVVPALDLVLVITGGLAEEEIGPFMEGLASILLPAIKRDFPLPADPDGMALLEALIQEAGQVNEEPMPVPPLPAAAEDVSGILYELDNNPFGWTAVSLKFPRSDEAVFLQQAGGIARESSIGLDGVWRVSPDGRFGLPIAMKGGWESDSVFTLDFDEVANINNGTIRLALEDISRVTVEISESTWHTPFVVNGWRKK